MKPFRKHSRLRLRKPRKPRLNPAIETDRKDFGLTALVLRYGALLAIMIVGGTLVMMTIVAAAWLYFAPGLPEIASIRDITLQTPLRVYTRDGRLIDEYGEKRRIPVEFEDLPEEMINAFLAAEDDRFLFHRGVDIAGLIRAFLEFIQSGEFRSGGSTITMQVARNYFLTKERTIVRKLKEILLAMQLEQEMTKQDILELYINKIYLGKRAYGAGAAARVYYGQDIDNLNLAQYAMIAGLPKAPSTFNPIANPERALHRRNWILGRMHELKYISEGDLREARLQPITARYHQAPIEVDAQHLGEMARSEMIRRLGNRTYTEGYKVYTSVDSGLQQAAHQAVLDGVINYDWRHGWNGPERQLSLADGQVSPATLSQWQQELLEIREINGLVAAVVERVGEQHFIARVVGGAQIRIDWQQGLSEARRHINENLLGPLPSRASDVVAVGDVVRLLYDGEGWLLRQLPVAEAALVAIDPSNGAVKALVGSFEFFENKFNHVTQSRRQPGSGMKPFIYAAGLEYGFHTATIFNDAPIVFADEQLEDVWRPTNDGGRFRGPTRFREALYRSMNLVSIRLMRRMGVDWAVQKLTEYGFDTGDMRRDLSLALGSHALTPLDMVAGYAIFANGGYRVKPWIIDRIIDRNGRVIYASKPVIVPVDCDTRADQCGQQGSGSGGGPADKSAVDLPHPETTTPTAPRVMDERIVYIMDSILHDVIERGTGRKARKLGRGDLAGKTGTTNGPVDAWFSGYNQKLVATTWLGFDNNQPLGRNEYGGSAALPIWMDFMRIALQGQQELRPEQPDGLAVVYIDPITGELAKSGQTDAILEVFLEENAPVGAGNEESEDSEQRSRSDRSKNRTQNQKVINQLY